MGISDVNARLSFLFFGEDSKMVRVKYGPNGLIYIFFDPHGMNVTVFRRYLNNLIAANKCALQKKRDEERALIGNNNSISKKTSRKPSRKKSSISD